MILWYLIRVQDCLTFSCHWQLCHSFICNMGTTSHSSICNLVDIEVLWLHIWKRESTNYFHNLALTLTWQTRNLRKWTALLNSIHMDRFDELYPNGQSSSTLSKWIELIWIELMNSIHLDRVDQLYPFGQSCWTLSKWTKLMNSVQMDRVE